MTGTQLGDFPNSVQDTVRIRQVVYGRRSTVKLDRGFHGTYFVKELASCECRAVMDAARAGLGDVREAMGFGHPTRLEPGAWRVAHSCSR